MDLGISGKRAAVAASSGGLGLGVARALAQAGCRVVVNGRDPDRLADAAATVDGAVTVPGDVGTEAGAVAFVDAATEALGGIDILVTNAGGPPAGTFATTPLDAYPGALELNLLASIAMCHRVVPGMREQRWGRVLAITSISVRQPIENLILSNNARAGLTGFLKTLATEVAPDGVTVNSLQPGLHATDRLRSLGTDLDRLAQTVPTRTVGDPDDFGRVAAFLCSDAAKFITGAAIPVDGGSHRGLQ
jgi:3-oxoacyl-[acyl-carrier protein] reductase